jgi:hypothetical protein
MSKRLLSIVLSAALAAGAFAALPAQSAGAQESKPFTCGELFTDAPDDADFENLDVLAGGVAANDDASFTVELRIKNLSTEVDPTDGQGLTWYFLWTSGDVTYFANAAYSMWTDAITYNLGTLDGTSFSTTAQTEGTFTEGENGSITVIVPYEEVGDPAAGAVLTQTYADTRLRAGGPAGPGLVSPVDRAPDGEAYGTDYTLGNCESGGPVAEEPPGKDDPPGKGKKKGCKKGKGKKKGACPGKKSKKPKPPAAAKCEAYTPGEEGKDAPLTVVTDAATEEAPVEVLIEQGPGLFPAASSDAFGNIQVDTGGAEAGLYIAYEFPVYEDHDLYLNYADGSEAARAAGFNQFPFVPGETDGTGNGGHSEQGAEMIDGLRTPDCAGYTARFNSFIGEGGEYTVKLWLGEIQNDPAAPGGGGQAVDLFFVLLGL